MANLRKYIMGRLFKKTRRPQPLQQVRISSAGPAATSGSVTSNNSFSPIPVASATTTVNIRGLGSSFIGSGSTIAVGPVNMDGFRWVIDGIANEIRGAFELLKAEDFSTSVSQQELLDILEQLKKLEEALAIKKI